MAACLALAASACGQGASTAPQSASAVPEESGATTTVHSHGGQHHDHSHDHASETTEISNEMLADGGCRPDLDDAGLLPPFFDLESYDFWSTSLNDGSAYGLATGAPVLDVKNGFLDALRVAASGDPGERYLLASVDDGTVVYGVVLRTSGEVDMVGLCVAWWEPLIAAYATSIGQRPADVLMAAFSDTRGEPATALQEGVERQWLGEEPDPLSWESTSSDERVYLAGLTPEEVLTELMQVRVAVKFPAEWRDEQITICPRAESAWNVCVSSRAAIDGHTVVWSIYVEPSAAIEWFSLGAEADFERAVPIGDSPPTLVTEAVARSGAVQLVLPDSPAAALGDDKLGGTETRTVLLSAEEVDAIEVSEARVGDRAESVPSE